LVFVWVLSGATSVLADNEWRTIGDIRSVCKDLLQSNDQSSLDSGVCIGWIKGEEAWRSGLCIVATVGAKEGKRQLLDDFSLSLARNVSNHSYEAMIQAFVNWADQNPQLWSKGLHLMLPQQDFWSEFPCKIDN